MSKSHEFLALLALFFTLFSLACGACTNDKYEPNNSISLATRANFNESVTVYDSISLVLCSFPKDVDFFELNITMKGTIEIKIGLFLIDLPFLVLYSESNELLAVCASTISCTMYYQIDEPGIYYLSVGESQTFTSDVSYFLDLNMVPDKTICEQDSFDEGNVTNYLSDGAYDITNLLMQGQGSLRPTTCNGRSDWFTFTSTNRFRLTIETIWDKGDVDIYLYKDDTSQEVMKVNTFSGDETLDYTGAAGTYYIALEIFEPGYGPYTANIQYKAFVVPPPAKKDNKSSAVGIGVGVTIAILVVIGAAVGLFFLYKKRKNGGSGGGKKEKKQSTIDVELATTVSTPSPSTQVTTREDPQRNSALVSALYLQDIEVQERLGGGRFGDVYKGLWNGTTPVALKLQKSDQLSDKQFENETALISKLNHPNIVRALGIFKDSNNTYLVMEYLSLGSLYDFMHKPETAKKLEQDDLVSMAIQLAAGCNYLEKMKIVHRDLALRNLLVTFVDGKYHIKISDLGMSKEVVELYQPSDNVFPVKWSPPEVIEFRKFTHKSDVWSFGICLWEIFELGKMPYSSFSNKETLEQVKNGYRLPKPDTCPESIYKIMQKCWEQDPKDRPSFMQIFSSLSELLKNGVDTYVPPEDEPQYNNA